MDFDVKVKINFSKKDLCSAISNALFAEITVNKNKKKVMEMNLYDLAEYLPEIIADEIIKDAKDILIQE